MLDPFLNQNQVATEQQSGSISRSFRWQTKSAGTQSANDPDLFAFNNLTVGNSYRIDLWGVFVSLDNTSTRRCSLYIASGIDTEEVIEIGIDASPTYIDSGDAYEKLSGSTIVKASATTIEIGCFCEGSGSSVLTPRATITELPNHVETADFT